MKHGRRRLESAILNTLFATCFLPRELEADEPARPRLFLSCSRECFEPYLRQELSYFDFVRDPYLADVTLVIVRQPSGSGGERFSVTPSGKHTTPGQATTTARSFLAPPGAPAHATRQELLRVVLRLLHAELTGTAHEGAFELRLPPRDGAGLSRLDDPWDYWVVAPELRGEGEGGSGYLFAEGTAALTIRRITDVSKLRLRGAYSHRWSNFRLEDGSRIHGQVYEWEGRSLYAHSLGQHWAVGAVGTGRASQFENLEGHAHYGPVVEYNFFPYTDNASEQLRLVYQAGAWANWYFEQNEAGLLREIRPYHAVTHRGCEPTLGEHPVGWTGELLHR